MPDLASKISRFSSFDLESYLNNSFQRYEESILENERHTISKIEHEIDTELLRTFLLNSDSLLNILNGYEESYRMVSNIVDLSKELVRCRMNTSEEEEVFVDKELVKKFRLILDGFGSEAAVFATDGRYLVHFDILKEKSGRKCILVLANDILLIGSVHEGVKKYRLLNAYSYSIVRMQVRDGLLEIRVDPTIYTFEKNKESVEHILRIYQELTYNYEEKTDDSVRKPAIDKELVDYLVFTEQYEHIEPSKLFLSSKATFHDKTEMVRYLSTISKTGGDVSSCIFPFLEERFKKGLTRINKIQPLGDFIRDVFKYFNEFLDEQNKLIKELEEVCHVKGSGAVLLVEKQLTRCIEALESRVFNKRYDVRHTDSVLELIKQNLKFSKYDFSYLMEHFLKKRSEYKKKCLDNAMRDIEEVIGNMMAN
ncbi:hypothetical protein M970_101730 [Encephalitozoon cuniculi EcunIII-L]|uniref:Uncharacterized protein n=1 Tax=Encephalitozoon cuniculi TaxID=6035 RepID=M1KBK8_ENCCN|nr:hypothetical protein ECU10_1780 [Encephalitozoon cuniculi]KMV65332.1 hypothetical protein M970_101730 [Encephalitozoon cuniculi EcunIII-L]UYI26644.1 hypothetical protein J0A71_02g04750 [Encephalitozoon cuniculi]